LEAAEENSRSGPAPLLYARGAVTKSRQAFDGFVSPNWAFWLSIASTHTRGMPPDVHVLSW